MARFEFKLPDIGEGIAEAEIVAWHVKVGDLVEEDQQLADMMTDKATVEMESPVAGTVVEVAGEVGDQIAIGSVLVVIETEGEAAATPTADGRSGGRRATGDEASPRRRPGRADRRASRRRSRASAEIARRRPARRRGPRAEPAGSPARASAASAGGAADAGQAKPAANRSRTQAVLASPAVRAARARPRHRPRPGEDRPATASATPISTPICSTAAARCRAPAAPRRQDEDVKVVGLRRKIAENMQEAKRRIPHFTYVDEIDVTALEATRAMMNADRGGNPEADPAAVPDHRDVPGAARLPDDQRALRRRGECRHPVGRGAHGHGDADR